MPTWEFTDPGTGMALEVTGDEIPSKESLDGIFAEAYQRQGKREDLLAEMATTRKERSTWLEAAATGGEWVAGTLREGNPLTIIPRLAVSLSRDLGIAPKDTPLPFEHGVPIIPNEPVSKELVGKALYRVGGISNEKTVEDVTGVIRSAQDLGNFFQTPEGLATLGTAAGVKSAGTVLANIAGDVLKAIYGTQMAHEILASWQDKVAAIREGGPDATRELVNTVAQTVLVGAIGGGPEVRSRITEGLRERRMAQAEEQAFRSASTGAAREQALEGTLPEPAQVVGQRLMPTTPIPGRAVTSAPTPTVEPPIVAEAGPGTAETRYPGYGAEEFGGRGKPGFLMTAEERVAAQRGETPRFGPAQRYADAPLARAAQNAEDAGLPSTAEAIRAKMFQEPAKPPGVTPEAPQSVAGAAGEVPTREVTGPTTEAGEAAPAAPPSRTPTTPVEPSQGGVVREVVATPRPAEQTSVPAPPSDVPSANITEYSDGITITNLRVPAAEQGQGVGTGIVQDVIKRSDETGKPVYVTAHADGPLLQDQLNRFYEGLGFRKYGEDPVTGKPRYVYEPGGSNAEGIRSDTGLVGETPRPVEEGQGNRGGNVEQAPPEQPQPVGARGKEGEALQGGEQPPGLAGGAQGKVRGEVAISRAQSALDTFRRLVVNPARQAVATAKGKVAKARAEAALREANAVDATARELFNDKTISPQELEERVKSITGDALQQSQVAQPKQLPPGETGVPVPEMQVRVRVRRLSDGSDTGVEFSEPYDGTAEGAASATQRLMRRVGPEWESDWSVRESDFFATDSSGKRKYSIAYNPSNQNVGIVEGGRERLKPFYREPTQGEIGNLAKNVPSSTPPPYQPPPRPFERGFQSMGITAQSHLLDAYDAIQRFRTAMSAALERRQPNEAWRVAYNSGNTRAVVFSKQVANNMRDRLAAALGKKPNDLSWQDEAAMSFVVESQGDRAALDAFRTKIEGSHQHWTEKYLLAIDHARNNWDRFNSVRSAYENFTRDELLDELAHGMAVPLRAGYVFHAQRLENALDMPFEGGSGISTGYMHQRTHATFADSIAAGVKPESIAAIVNLESRIRRGQQAINRRQWIEAGKKMTDPVTGKPIVADAVSYSKEVPVVEDQGFGPQMTGAMRKATGFRAPSGDYELVDYAGRQLAILKGYVGAFQYMTDPSWFARSRVGRAALATEGSLKHGLLLFDTFHLGRLAYYTLGLSAVPRFKKGSLLLDYDQPTLLRMRNRGEITPELYAEIMAKKPTLDLLIKQGYNLGGIEDAIYSHWIRRLPGIGTYNKWLFERFQRGAMAHVGLLEFERQSKMYPKLSPEQVARKVAKELNTRFGNLRGESMLRSKTAQDLARLFFLAPQWNEGLIRSELKGVAGMPKAAWDTVTARRVVASALTRDMATLFVGGLVAAQIINYWSRGHSTFENPERGPTSKISAWIPDFIGNSAGFFFNPAVLPFEIVNQVVEQIERKGKLIEAAMDVVGFKRSPILRAIDVLRTQKSQWGKPLTTDLAVAKEALYEAAPIPIPGRAALNVARMVGGAVGHAVGANPNPPQISEDFPGQSQKQLAASIGFKLSNAPTAESRMYSAADEFRHAHNLKEPPQGEDSPYRRLVTAVKIGNDAQIADELEALRKTTEADAKIIQHFRLWPTRPILPSFRLESQFKATLNAEEQQAYQRMREERQRIAAKVLALIKANPRK